MEEVGVEVRRALRAAGVPDAGVLADLVRLWPEAVGPAVASAAWPQRIARDGTLHVATTSSVWAFELGRLEPEVREKLHRLLGDDTPDAIRFAPGHIPEPPLADDRTTREPLSPTDEERSLAASLSASIDSPELRQAVAQAAAASLAAARDDRVL